MNDKIHPYKFSMWIAIASMSMFFGGLTSAYIVRSSQTNWQNITTPSLFNLSTIIILLSSFTLIKTIQYYKKEKFKIAELLLLTTIILGILFIVFQIIAFKILINNGIFINGNVAGSFIYLIVGAHLVHILGGIIALLIVYLKLIFLPNNNKWKVINKMGNLFLKIKSKPNVISLEIIAIYWHFVDILWIYLVIFYCIMK